MLAVGCAANFPSLSSIWQPVSRRPNPDPQFLLYPVLCYHRFFSLNYFTITHYRELWVIVWFRPVVLMGLETGENLYINDGKCDASYIPAIIRRYPFALAKTPEQDDNCTVCIDNSSELVNEIEGEPLFDAAGKPSEMMERVKRYLAELQQMEKFTQEFCHFLAEYNMFTPLNMKVRQQDEIKNITDCYVANEERLGSISDKGFLNFRKKQFLPAMYAHLISLAQIERLLKFKEQTETSLPTEQFPALNPTELH
jgi:hypothetical protein